MYVNLKKQRPENKVTKSFVTINLVVKEAKSLNMYVLALNLQDDKYVLY